MIKLDNKVNRWRGGNSPSTSLHSPYEVTKTGLYDWRPPKKGTANTHD